MNRKDSRKDNGGPAFPRAGYEDRSSGSMSDGDRVVEHENGMTLRDYFAAKAMQGLLAQSIGTAFASDPKHAAEYAYATADAMLAERAK